MYRITQDGLVRFRRPYPFDLERKRHVQKVMDNSQIKSTVDLARKLRINYTVLTEIINGTRISRGIEERIAAFFGMKREELFILRTTKELIAMHDAQAKRKGAA